MWRRTWIACTKLVVVESPNKVIKIEGLLSDPRVVPDWSFEHEALRVMGSGPEKAVAMATTGHFMALKEVTWTPQPPPIRPPADSDYPVNGVLASFALEWEIMPGRKIQDSVAHYIKEKSGDISEIIVATDPDREGELIALHALNLIRRMYPDLGVPFTRAYIHSITEDGVRTAMRERRTQFDHHLANAAEARHVMDRIFGFLGSSVVRFANPNMRSIGRVQTPALILISEREDRIRHFLETHRVCYEVRSLCHFMSSRGTSFAQAVVLRPLPGPAAEAVEWESAAAVKQLGLSWRLEGAHDFRVVGTPLRQSTTSPPPKPFTMATIITKANRQLHLSSDAVSSCLQDLFQMGHITYPRTDSTRIDNSVRATICHEVRRQYGKAMVYRPEEHTASERTAPTPRRRHGTAGGGGGGDDEDEAGGDRNVEDAHEAIRPTDIRVKAADLGALATSTKEVYELIRQNTLAAFMQPVVTERVAVTVQVSAGSGARLEFRLEGKHTVEPGWSVAFRKGHDGEGDVAGLDVAASEEGLAVVPSVSAEEFDALVALKDTLVSPSRQSPASGGATAMRLESWQVCENRPSPPLPYTEGGLIEELKNHGVGRPSTYPMIVKTLLARNYITVNAGGRCETTPVGRLLVETSKTTFPSIVDIGFTASFEKKLDRIAKPNLAGHAFLRSSHITEADYVLSCFVSKFLNYVTEATRTQRGLIAARSMQLRREQAQTSDAATVVESEAEFAASVEKEKQRCRSLVPDLLEVSKSYRTFTALQNNLNDYLRRNFPPLTTLTVSRAGEKATSHRVTRTVRHHGSARSAVKQKVSHATSRSHTVAKSYKKTAKAKNTRR